MEDSLKEGLKQLQFVRRGASAMECIVCDASQGRIYSVAFEDLTALGQLDLCICGTCAKEFMAPEDYKKIWGKKKGIKSLDVKAFWDAVSEKELCLTDKLRAQYPTFLDRLIRYTGHDVTYSDGSEHELLASIYKQVEERDSPPSEKQAQAFVKVFDELVKQKDTQGFLMKETECEIEDRKELSKSYLALAHNHKHKFTGKTHQIFDDFQDYFDNRGTLSVKQLSFLTKLIEELPDSVLAELR